MSTEKQEMALEKMVENGGNASRAMLEVGYSPNTAKTPQKLTESKGYKAILADCGHTESFIVSNLVSDIKKKPQKRLGELTLAFEILGMRKKGLIIEDKTEEKYTRNDEYLNELAIRMGEEIKNKKTLS